MTTHNADTVVCPACDETLSLKMEPGQASAVICRCGLVMQWDGDCHVSWDGGAEKRIRASRGPLLIDGKVND